MGKEQLTIAKMLGFARHDFLNKLQVILMHIDLDDIPAAKKSILNATDEMRQQSKLDLLGLPETSKWLMTFDWLYPAYQNTLTCTGRKSGIRKANDSEIAAFLEQAFLNLEVLLNPIMEYEAHIDVNSSSTDWSIQITVKGILLEEPRTMNKATSFVVKETSAHNLWTFTLSGQ